MHGTFAYWVYCQKAFPRTFVFWFVLMIIQLSAIRTCWIGKPSHYRVSISCCGKNSLEINRWTLPCSIFLCSNWPTWHRWIYSSTVTPCCELQSLIILLAHKACGLASLVMWRKKYSVFYFRHVFKRKSFKKYVNFNGKSVQIQLILINWGFCCACTSVTRIREIT